MGSCTVYAVQSGNSKTEKKLEIEPDLRGGSAVPVKAIQCCPVPTEEAEFEGIDSAYRIDL
jgi:hypothetical protein